MRVLTKITTEQYRQHRRAPGIDATLLDAVALPRNACTGVSSESFAFGRRFPEIVDVADLGRRSPGSDEIAVLFARWRNRSSILTEFRKPRRAIIQVLHGIYFPLRILYKTFIRRRVEEF